MNRELDALVDKELRHLSRLHWTPASVAVRAVRLLCPVRNTRVLDIGSGAGKLCVVGALSMRGTWFGIEHHAPLVIAARTLAEKLGVADRTTFIHGDAFALDWNEYDALYMYNPFELALFEGPGMQVDSVEQRLAALRPGVRVVTLNGFGGEMPKNLALVSQEHLRDAGVDLVLWVSR